MLKKLEVCRRVETLLLTDWLRTHERIGYTSRKDDLKAYPLCMLILFASTPQISTFCSIRRRSGNSYSRLKTETLSRAPSNEGKKDAATIFLLGVSGLIPHYELNNAYCLSRTLIVVAQWDPLMVAGLSKLLVFLFFLGYLPYWICTLQWHSLVGFSHFF